MPVIVHEKTIVRVGASGIPGPPGPAGGGQYHRHDQTAAAAVWTINHNFGRRAAVAVFSTGGREMLAEVLHTSENQATVYFDAPVAGYAICN